jgi:hypothetical protein
MSRNQLIDAYLRDLRAVLPADVLDELTDGLIETYDRLRDRGLAPDDAARAALADFGALHDIVEAFADITPGRRAARMLLATGPLAGTCWALALLTGHAWRWPVPLTGHLAFAALMLMIVATLVTAARATYIHTRRTAAITGTGGLLLLDATAITTALVALDVTWPLLPALAASLTRTYLSASALHRILSSR